ncbi:MAG: thioredoxin family protein [Chloroflexota bacterium]|nr:MAG: thioredoxin family protein [Chloroflexota bacterium]
MIERLLLSLAIALLITAVLLALRFVHTRRASRLSAEITAGDARPTILYFRGDNCGPCLAQSHHLRQLEQELGDRLAVQEIDAERDGELAARYGIFTLPTTLVADRGGHVKHINYGLAATTKLARQLESVL